MFDVSCLNEKRMMKVWTFAQVRRCYTRGTRLDGHSEFKRWPQVSHSSVAAG